MYGVLDREASEPYFLPDLLLWNAAVRVCLETDMPPVFGKEDECIRVFSNGDRRLC
jgi:hypothetical protein